VLSVVPLWIPDILPLVDVPQHAAQAASLRQILAGNPVFAADFEVNWFTPFLGGSVLLLLVSLVMPILPATKLVLSAAVISLPLVTGALLKDLGGDERLKWLAIPGAYSFAVYWGDLAYVVAVPIALGLLPVTIRYERHPTAGRMTGVAIYSTGLFFCHVVALAFGALISLAFLAGKNLHEPRRLARCAIPYAAPLPLIALWALTASATDATVQSPIVLGSMRERLGVLFMQFSGLDGFAFGVGLIEVTAIVLLPFVAGYRVSTKPERWMPLAVGGLFYLACPSVVYGTSFLFQRFAVFLIPLWLMVWQSPVRPSRVFPVAVVAVVAAWFWVNAQRFAGFSEESQPLVSVMREAEGGGRMAGMLLCNGSEYFVNPVYLHVVAWYQAEFNGISDMSFAMLPASLVRYRDMKAPRLGEQHAWTPSSFEWDRDGGAGYDYFLVCAGGNAARLLFKDHTDSVDLVAHEAEWWLYRNVDPVDPVSP